MRIPRPTLIKWLLAILDGIWAFVFMFMGYMAVSFTLRLAAREMGKLNADVVMMPELTVLLMNVLPEAGWALLIGIVCLAAIYGRLSFDTQEPVTGRLFRWSVVVIAFMLLVACIPLIDLMSDYPPMLTDDWWLDELAFLLICISMALFVFMRPPRSQQQSV